MFERLSERIQSAVRTLRGQGNITESNIQESLRAVRLALLEADVHVSVVKTFLEGVKQKALGQEVLQGLSHCSRSVRLDGEHLALTLDSEVDLPQVNRYLVEQGVDVYSLRPEHVSLEDLFIQIVGTDGGL